MSKLENTKNRKSAHIYIGKLFSVDVCKILGNISYSSLFRFSSSFPLLTFLMNEVFKQHKIYGCVSESEVIYRKLS